MKKMLRLPRLAFIAVMIMSSMSLNLFGQPGVGREHDMKREKIQAQKIAFITDKLELSPEVAQKFWPVYNEAQKMKEQEMKEFRKNNDVKDMRLEELSDEELTEIADNMILHQERMNDIDKTYHAKYKSILSPKQMVLLYESEKEFKFFLLRQLREHQKPGPPVERRND